MCPQGPAEKSSAPREAGFELSPIIIPGAENMDDEIVEELKALFKQAGEDNPSLEPEDRAFFLHREDVFGLAVALPGLLTEDQGYWIVGRPPPKMVKQAIRDEYNLDSIAEVVKYVTENMNGLTDRQFRLFLRNFHPIGDELFDTGGTLLASLSSPNALSTDGFVQAASNSLLDLEGTGAILRKAALVYHAPERRRVRREKTLQRMRELDSMSEEESLAWHRDMDEKRAAWEAGAAARQEAFAEIERWGEASSKLSDGQLAEMRRLRELGPEAVQRAYLKSLGVSEEDIESYMESTDTDE